MTTLNTIIEEEKKKLEDTAGYNYNLYLAGTVRRADTGEDWTFEQAEKELKNFLATAMQRAYEVGRTDSLAKIPMLRQWLNEDKITDVNRMVTNEQIRYWLTGEE